MTTFDQRRLIKQQVRAGLFIAPVKGGSKYSKQGNGKLWDSEDEDTSSEEDLHWLQKKLHEDGDLDDESKRLLQGILTQSYKDRKNPDLHKRPVEQMEEAENTDSDPNAHLDGEDDSELDLGAAGRDNFIRPGAQYDVKAMDPNEKGISREEQLRRMNILAKEFNFYAMDRPEQKYLNRRISEVRQADNTPKKTRGFCMVL